MIQTQKKREYFERYDLGKIQEIEDTVYTLLVSYII